MTLQEFIDAHAITLDYQDAPNNPHMTEMPRGSRHYKVTLICGDAPTMEVYYSKGPALPYGVELPEVLDCLASDAAGYENARHFEDWVSEYGYDPDSRKAEAIYRTVETQSHALRDLLGEDAYKTLLWDVERL